MKHLAPFRVCEKGRDDVSKQDQGQPLEDLRNEETGAAGYAKRLSHGEIGKGLNDYDQIFSILKNAGFNGWISIEDGVDGFDQLQRSVAFVRKKILQYWPV